jgi:ubiquitin C-terminal hydrolase
MTNSTTTGTSDYSNYSIKNGGSSYSYSTSTSKTIGLVGLNNIGNTCFMYNINYFRNSILQCMFNLPSFNEYFLSGKYES